MKNVLIVVAVLLLGSAMPARSECGLKNWPCYEAGSVVPITFEYDGTNRKWDGIISLGGLHDPERLAVVNGCFLIVSRGLGEFHKPILEPGKVPKYWQTLEAKRGELVPPIGDGPDSYWAMVAFKKPFATLVDLSKHYDLRVPGVYTVWWGIHDLCETEIVFEVIPSGTVAASQEDVIKRYAEGN